MSDGAEIPGVRIRIRDPGDRERAVKSARDFARSLGFEGNGAEEIALVVSELASNAEKYAGTEGTIALDGVRDAAGRGLEIVYQAPPGSDPRNGNGRPSLGIGLDVIRNHVDEFLGGRGDGSGVRITLRKFLPGGEPACRAEVSALSLPASGQSVNGDGFFADRSECRLLLGVFDGLGHGPGAHEVSQRLQKTFAAGRGWDLETLLPRCQKAIEGTRGAAFAAVRIDLATGAGAFAGIGNVETRWMGSASKVSFVPHAGILGRAGQAVRVEPFRLKPPGTLVMVSDGISLRALEEHFERAGASGAAALASRLVHEAGRAHDDRTAVVARLNPNAARKE